MKHLYVCLLLSVMVGVVSCTDKEVSLDVTPYPVKVCTDKGTYSLSKENLNEAAEIMLDRKLADSLGPEGYCLEITENRVKVLSATETGAFYAGQTLKQMSLADVVPCCTIVDKPRFAYRAIHLDVSRHFFAKEEVMKLLEEMAYYKLNVFHFHLTDNGGWRFESDRYPLLTGMGSYRTLKDWYQWFDKGDRRFVPEGTPGAYGGYYTKAELKEIVHFADSLHITVIPEIEFPAHSDAVMAGYPELCCTGKPFTSGEFCVGNEKSFDFMENILMEVMEIFPSEYIHIGGDEARKVAWKTCPKCQALIADAGLDGVEDLQCYMVDRIQKFLVANGRKMIGWDEILKNQLRPETIVMSYRGQKGGIEAANRGVYSVMTPGEVLYFDWYPADPATEPRSMYGFSPIRKMYSFSPVPTDAATAVRNQELVDGKMNDGTAVPHIFPENASQVIGVQGCMWTEYVEDADRLEYMLFPRLLAVAELAWTPESVKDWNDFKRRISLEVPRLRSRGWNAFQLSDDLILEAEPASSADGGLLVEIDSERYGADIRYSLDGSEPTSGSLKYDAPFVVHPGDSIVIKAAVITDDDQTGPVLTRTLKRGMEIRECYPFIPPELWLE